MSFSELQKRANRLSFLEDARYMYQDPTLLLDKLNNKKVTNALSIGIPSALLLGLLGAATHQISNKGNLLRILYTALNQPHISPIMRNLSDLASIRKSSS